MIPNVTLGSESPLSKGKHECRVQSMITENVKVDFVEGLPAPFIVYCQIQYWRRA